GGDRGSDPRRYLLLGVADGWRHPGQRAHRRDLRPLPGLLRLRADGGRRQGLTPIAPMVGAEAARRETTPAEGGGGAGAPVVAGEAEPELPGNPQRRREYRTAAEGFEGVPVPAGAPPASSAETARGSVAAPRAASAAIAPGFGGSVAV